MENDGKKYDCGKVRMDLVPLDVVENIGKVLTYGAQKYSDNSWQNLPDFWKRYKAGFHHGKAISINTKDIEQDE